MKICAVMADGEIEEVCKFEDLFNSILYACKSEKEIRIKHLKDNLFVLSDTDKDKIEFRAYDVD